MSRSKAPDFDEVKRRVQAELAKAAPKGLVALRQLRRVRARNGHVPRCLSAADRDAAGDQLPCRSGAPGLIHDFAGRGSSGRPPVEHQASGSRLGPAVRPGPAAGDRRKPAHHAAIDAMVSFHSRRADLMRERLNHDSRRLGLRAMVGRSFAIAHPFALRWPLPIDAHSDGRSSVRCWPGSAFRSATWSRAGSAISISSWRCSPAHFSVR